MRPPGPLEIGLIAIIITIVPVIFIIWLAKRVIRNQVSIEVQNQAHKKEQEKIETRD